VIEEQKILKEGVSQKLVSGKFIEYGFFNNSFYKPAIIHNLFISAPSTDLTESSISSTNQISLHPAYKPQVYFDKYGSSGGNLEVFHKANDKLQSYIWDYNSSLPIAEIVIANQTSVAYTSFEADGTGNWSGINSSYIQSTGGITGSKYYNQPSFSLSKSELNSSDYYIVSYWSRNSAAYSISGTQTNWPKKLRTITINGQEWNYYEHLVSGQTTVTITGSGIIDELRLYPKDAQMSTYTYDPLIGVTSKCDANNLISYYEYDGLGRLTLVRDQDKNIIKKICYNYQGQQENCGVTYYSVQKSGNFTRNNCATGGTGSTVTYTVAAGTYSSTTSQAAADQLAQNDVNANGQTYANINGTCTFYNVQKSGSFTRNNCGSGYTGSTVTYTVAANTYSSTNSQAAADQLAQNDVDANGQTYANNNGTCTLTPVTLTSTNNVGVSDFYARYTNTSTNQQYDFAVSSATGSVTLGSIPPGTYNIYIRKIYSHIQYWFSVGNLYVVFGTTGTFSNISISNTSNNTLAIDAN
jgi:hypothetical protein